MAPCMCQCLCLATRVWGRCGLGDGSSERACKMAGINCNSDAAYGGGLGLQSTWHKCDSAGMLSYVTLEGLPQEPGRRIRYWKVGGFRIRLQHAEHLSANQL